MRVGKTKPINKIKISGKDVLDINLDQEWEITNVDFDDCCPPSLIDALVVTFRKTGKGLAHKQNVEIVRE